MKLKAAITAGDDFAFGYEQVGGFQSVFEDDGGRVVKKLWSPFNSPDYVPYLAQIDPKEADVVVPVYAGANPLKFIKQYRDQGINLPLLGGSTVADDSIMRNFGDEVIGLINSIPYTLDLDTDANRRFIASMRKYFGADSPIGFYAAALYVNGQILEAALQATGGDVDPDKLIAAIRRVSLAETPRGPVKFDDYGNLTFTVYIRKVEKKGGKLVNTTIKSYPDVSQFWHREPKEFLKQPVFSRRANLERLSAGLHRAGRQLCAVSRTHRRWMAYLERLSARLHDTGRRLCALSRSGRRLSATPMVRLLN
jgi:branched-chain amino acid transport system substrate-binding protein